MGEAIPAAGGRARRNRRRRGEASVSPPTTAAAHDSTQVKAARSFNAELVLLYWRIGRDVLARQKQDGWGAHVVDRLSADLHDAFPGMKGFSARNLKYMRAFAETWPDRRMVQAPLAQLTWYHTHREHFR